MSGWSLVFETYAPEHEGTREALCTLANGYFGTRGAALEADADAVHYPGTYLAGGFNRRRTEIRGVTLENESLVNLPNWLALRVRCAGGEWLHPDRHRLLAYRQELDLRQGVLRRSLRFEDADGRRTRLEERRLVHMGEPHLAAVELRVTPENWQGTLELRSELDGNVVNDNVPRYRDLEGRHLRLLAAKTPRSDMLLLKMSTLQSELRIAQAARTCLYANGTRLDVTPRVSHDRARISATWSLEAQAQQTLTVEKILTLYSSRDDAISEPALEAAEGAASAAGFEALHEQHTLIWRQLWDHFDLCLEHARPEEGARTELILRLHVFHILQVASLHTRDLDVGVPARGLHGEAYRGHIFWDELFVFPLLNLRVPEITRSMLLYRFRRLDRARLAAREAGHSGAMYPWQSGSNGREESQTLHLNPRSGRWKEDRSRLQRHVNHAIAYNVWQYYQVSADVEFMAYFGAEMMLEIARFVADLTRWNEALERYEIHRVMGPDEFHEAYPDSEQAGLDNNAYTNVMTVWLLTKTLQLQHVLPAERWQELCELLNLRDEEFDHWRDICRRMHVVFHDGGIISQFEGYERLQEFDWEGYRNQYHDIHRLDRILEAEGDDVNRYKASKQADVLMLFYLFSSEELCSLFAGMGYRFTPQMIPRNIRYYLQRTSHGSTLSSVVHSRVLSRSDRAGSWKQFARALESDISDVQGGTTREGIHLGAMAGTVDLIQRGYTGIDARDDVLWLDPVLPSELEALRLRIRYRGHTLDLYITQQRLIVRSLTPGAAAVAVGFRSRQYRLHGEAELQFTCDSGQS